MANPGLKVSRPVRPQLAVSSLNRLRAEALGDLAIGIDRPDGWSGVVRIRPRRPLDRVAQMADRKYCATVPPWLPA